PAFATSTPRRGSRCCHARVTGGGDKEGMRLVAVLIPILLLPAAVAAAESTPAADFDLSFGAQRPAAATPAHIRIVYTNPDDPNAAPSPQSRIVIELPRGSSVRGSADPVITRTGVALQ